VTRQLGVEHRGQVKHRDQTEESRVHVRKVTFPSDS
jgi:hypothetical protein